MALGNAIGIGIPMVNLGLGGGAGSAIPELLALLQARATYYENVVCTTATLTELENIV
tara:strand:+ start:808 stop:981 length:174 start_codon:yes stop_codon:yes gene_type:complete